MNDVKSRVIAIVTGKTLPEAIEKVNDAVPAEAGEVTVAVVKEDCGKDLTVCAGRPIPVVETTTRLAVGGRYVTRRFLQFGFEARDQVAGPQDRIRSHLFTIPAIPFTPLHFITFYRLLPFFI